MLCARIRLPLNGVDDVLLLVTIGATLALAWANGVNDVSKGVATLVGSRCTTYRRALCWGTLWTAAGAAASLLVAAGLIGTFSTELVAADVAALPQLAAAVAGGAFIWVLMASVTGMPVSTTHALTGALIGTGVMVGGSSGVRWTPLLTTIVLPLAFSPLVAGLLARVVHAALHRPLTRASSVCVCFDEGGIGLQPLAGGALSVAVAVPVVHADRVEACTPMASARMLVLTDGLHWATSGLLSFARGMNDMPKILALSAVALTVFPQAGLALIGLGVTAMSLGSLFGRRVTRTLAERVTEIDPIEGLASSGVAAGLVLLASFVTLPVSTTHVATGAIVGAGMSGGRDAVRWREVAHIGLAWFVTLPASAGCAAIVIGILA